MKPYNSTKIEKKWQKVWTKEKVYKTLDKSKKSKFYILDMFPYPSGHGLHVGHFKGYMASDVISRMKMMQGYNVLHPMGWDAFGLPAENFAIKNNIHPSKATAQNIKNFKSQMEIAGFSYDWDREINTTDPKYYKWTQWMFKKMFEKGLVREVHEPVNWCPSCKTVLAAEDTEGGRCERCSSEIERKPIREWSIAITNYADRLLEDMQDLDWEPFIKEQQVNWIGKSVGAEIDFKLKDTSEVVKIFTTRLDTIFGCTYVVLAPEHKLLNKLQDKIWNWDEVETYIGKAKQKSNLQRQEGEKDKTGLQVEGIKAVNPFNGEEVNIFVADYVLPHYGTGSIMAVPAHDERDYDFAEKYRLQIKQVIQPKDKKEIDGAFCNDGILINSGEFTGLTSQKAREELVKFAKQKGFGKETTNYKMRDWVFARQRYWGEPFPLIYCEHCAEKIKNKQYKKGEFTEGELLNPGWISVPDKDLPVKLPNVESFKPTDGGESPLAASNRWVNVKCPKCGGKGKRETNTMPQWAGSCWYYLRYLDPKNDKMFADKNKDKYWSPVDLYIGGAEHATRHLIYARFWHKFLYDLGLVNYKEPFMKLQHVGLVMGPDGQKMSKRWGNVVVPNDVVKEYGADSMRVYEMFMGPFADTVAWNMNGVLGAKRFLDKVWSMQDKINKSKKFKTDKNVLKALHQTIRKATEDIPVFKFNTAISQMMIFANTAEGKEIALNDYLAFIKILAPFAPHLCEEIYQENSGKKKFISIFNSEWPKYQEKYLVEEEVELPIQINGKVRSKIVVDVNITEEEIKKIVAKDDMTKKWTEGKKIVKIIYINKRLINIVAQ